LYYVAAGLSGGGVFAGLIWNQYLVQSPQAIGFGIADLIPTWVAPRPDSPAITHRNLLHPDWYVPIGLILLFQILGRLNWFGLGYFLFRITSDVEKLPFPLAPIAAEGATALAEVTAKEETWRWRVFSTGSMIGILFGMLYVGIPAVTGVIMSKPIMLLPIPFIDFTSNTESYLPAAMMGLSLDLGGVLTGMVIPFPIVVGSFISTILTSVIGNPILQKLGYFPHWHKGMSLIPTKISIDFDFWMSIGIGTAIAVALIGLWTVFKTLIFHRQKDAERRFIPPPGRGDFPLWIALSAFIVSTLGYIIICHKLVPLFPVWILCFFGFIWTPLNSYISARMIGLTGNGVGFPYLKEGTFILSGYKGIDIWFAPIPLNDYGGLSQMFRSLELTGTKITSIIKAEILMIPIGVICSFAFWAFFWHLNAIPSAAYPFTAKMWPLNVTSQCIFMTATMPQGNNWLLKAIKLKLILSGLSIGLILYWLTLLFKLPILFYYGFIGGIGGWPTGAIPMFIGALLGKYYFRKKFGEPWNKYTPVLLAGFLCGMGLVGMVSVAFALISKSVSSLPF
jgi:hypothetical protein